MTARTLEELLAEGETPETIKGALSALNDIKPNPMPAKYEGPWAELRAELEAELAELSKQQGSLF